MTRAQNDLNTTSSLTALEVCQVLTDVALGETHHDAKLHAFIEGDLPRLYARGDGWLVTHALQGLGLPGLLRILQVT